MKVDQQEALRSEIERLQMELAAANQKNQDIESKYESLKRSIHTCGNKDMSLEGRVFSVDKDGVISDGNFDFDAALQVSGDFVGDQKVEYAQMLCAALNNHQKLAAKIRALENEVAHWKCNHDTQVKAARAFKERHDIPLNRIRYYDEFVEMRKKIESTQHDPVLGVQLFSEEFRNILVDIIEGMRTRAINNEMVKSSTLDMFADELQALANRIHENKSPYNLLNMSDVIPLTIRKATHIVEKEGYKLTGFVLSKDNDKKAIVDMSAVRWYSKESFFRMMHDTAKS